MRMTRLRRHITALVGALITLSLVSTPVLAMHNWGSYHWARNTVGQVTVRVGNNVAGTHWDAKLTEALADWHDPESAHSRFLADQEQFRTWTGNGFSLRDPGDEGPWTSSDPVVVLPSDTLAGSNCSPVAGTIQVCAANYGRNGWLGLAQIWVSKGHITQATAKQNDYYFTDPTEVQWYENNFGDLSEEAIAADQQLVICQELAHGFGLDHNDETFGNDNTGTCMDYGNTPWGDEHPNYHDYQQLASIYSHNDSTTRKGGGKKGARSADQPVTNERPLGNNARDWGEVTGYDSKGRPSHFRKNLEEGREVFTFVIYAHQASGAEVGPAPADGGGGHAHDGSGDQGKKADSKRDGGKKADNKRDGGKKSDNKRDGGKKSQKRQGQHDNHNHNH